MNFFNQSQLTNSGIKVRLSNESIGGIADDKALVGLQQVAELDTIAFDVDRQVWLQMLDDLEHDLFVPFASPCIGHRVPGIVVEALLESVEVNDDHFVSGQVEEEFHLAQHTVQRDLGAKDSVYDPQFLGVTFDRFVGDSQVEIPDPVDQLIEDGFVVADDAEINCIN